MVMKHINMAHVRQKFAAIILICIIIFICHQLFYPNIRIALVNSVSLRTVRVPEDYNSIQKAINYASDGDVVFVSAGVYKESIFLNKSIILLGENRDYTIIDAENSSDVITVMSSNCVICGFTIRNGGLSRPANYGIKLCNVDNVSIINNTITGNFVGIKLGDKRRGCSTNIIANNIISGNRYGIFLDHSSGNIIYGNYIAKNFWNGIELAWSDSNKIYNNTICCNMAYGLEIPFSTPSRYNIIYHNNFINNMRSVSASGYENKWDDGYPSGGNYWSDYKGVDNMFGVYQNLTGRDCIGDVPYIIDTHNCDNYPLTLPFALLNPVVDFVFYPESPKVCELVVFNVSIIDPVQIINCSWDFGDGYTSHGQVVGHKYGQPGTFKVQLNVTNARGFSSIVTKLVTVHSFRDAGDANFNIKRMFLLGFILAVIMLICFFLKNRHNLRVKKHFSNNLYKRDLCMLYLTLLGLRLSNITLNKWFFIIVFSVTLVITIPLVVVWFILQLGPELRLIATVVVILLWGAVAGYKDWVIAKRKEEESQEKKK